MAEIPFTDNEQIIAEFQPSQNAKFYYLLLNPPVRFFITLFLLYHFTTDIIHLVTTRPPVATVVTTQDLAPDSSASTLSELQNSSFSKPISFSFSYQWNGALDFSQSHPGLYKLYLGVLGLFLCFFAHSTLRKQKAVLASIQYTLTNKRIIVSQRSRPGYQSIYFNRQTYCIIQQTSIHRFFKIYYLFFSIDPNDPLSPHPRSSRRREIVDMISKAQADIINNAFIRYKEEHSIENARRQDYFTNASAAENAPLSTTAPSIIGVSRYERVFIQASPYYALPLSIKLFLRYNLYLLIFCMLFLNVIDPKGKVVFEFIWQDPMRALIIYLSIFTALAVLMSIGRINFSKFILTDKEFIVEKWPRFYRAETLPYQEVSYVKITRGIFNFYQVTIQAKQQRIPTIISGLSKKNAEKIQRALSQRP